MNYPYLALASIALGIGVLSAGESDLKPSVGIHSGTSSPEDRVSSSNYANSSLVTGPNATLLRDGKTYRGIGINYFDCFLRTLLNGNDLSYDAGFSELASRGIPFARFCATGFWPRDMKLYQTDRAEYFRRLDGVVDSAKRHGIGLVPSLFWNYSSVPDLVGEPMDQWGNPRSKTHGWMREYIREVVTRYRDNPAIWAWEFGNEYSLQASLPNAESQRPKAHPDLGTPELRSERDDITYAMVRIAFVEFGKAVREYDRKRIILTGDSFPRHSAWHQENQNNWTTDTPEQFIEALRLANPDPINAISLHAYEDDARRFAMAMQVAREINKPVFVGEFGTPGDTPEEEEKFRLLLNAIMEQEIPLAALWVYDFDNQKEWNVTTGNARAWQLDLIAQANRQLRDILPAAVKARDPDVFKIPSDLDHPGIAQGEPAPGKLVLQSLPAYAETEVVHSVYLPSDWKKGRRFPVIVEYLGNKIRVRDNQNIGYAISGGKGFIWVVLPFVSADGKRDMDWWWGDVNATVAYAKEAIPAICRRWGGDPERVILTGYSRGAIACNYIGLHDDEIARLWCASIPVSHYDDAHTAWGMNLDDKSRAPERLRRLGKTPQLICGEYSSRWARGSDSKLLGKIHEKGLTSFAAAKTELELEPLTTLEGTREFVTKHHPGGNFTIVNFAWVNHGPDVMHRDTSEREQLRNWLGEVLRGVPVK
jgi:Cellulase (glycosyl hydrolase family 5)